MDVVLGEEAQQAARDGNAIVALESTVYSTLGLPAPHNEDALQGCLNAIRAVGAIPAVTAVIDGQLRAGLDDDDYPRLLAGTRKIAERDLAAAVATGLDVGVTTVSASLAIAAQAGIRAFATGGIGGVHRGSAVTGDVSADLGAIARHPVATFSAGAKSFLDLPMTLEKLEQLGVPVVGYQCDEFPAFTARSSGLPVPFRVDSADVAAAIVRVQTAANRGLLVVTPVPEGHALDQQLHDEALDAALAAADDAGVHGAAVTPFVLERIAHATEGRSLPANIALVVNNATLAAEVAIRIDD